MLMNATVEKMQALKLTALAEAFQAQMSRPEFAELEFAERVGLMVDAEWTSREQRKQRRRLEAAKLRHQACLEDVDWTAPRGLDRSVILSLGTCGFIHDHRNLLITGSTGVGKSFLACAFAERACRSGYSAYYIRAPRLYHDLSVSRADGSYGRLLQKLKERRSDPRTRSSPPPSTSNAPPPKPPNPPSTTPARKYPSP